MNPAANTQARHGFAVPPYHLPGVPAETVLHDSLNRPHQLVIGQRVSEVLS